MIHLLLACAALTGASNEKYVAWFPERTELQTLPTTIGSKLAPQELQTIAAGPLKMPFTDLTAGVQLENREVWVGSHNGLMHLSSADPNWRLFHSQRWLPSDDVLDLSVASNGDVFVKTPTGVAKLARRETTLEEKMKAINAMIQRHHVRLGFITAASLPEPGKLEGSRVQGSDDNDGLWTSLYIAAEAFRYGATGDPEAKKNARRSLEALMFLEKITGISGFAARSYVPIEDEGKKYGGEWHKSADGKWWWKGDTSSDEIDGHYFAYSIYYNTAADEKEKEEIRPVVARITDHIIKNGFNYVGPSGQPTTWGVWAPDKLNHDLRRLGDRGLNSLQMLSFLKVAHHICGDTKYAQAAKELIEKHAYATNTVEQKKNWPPQWVNHSDDELAFVAYYPLVIDERDPDLRMKYMASIRRTYMIERPEHSPFFNLIFGAALQANQWTDPTKRPDRAYVSPDEYDRNACLAWFRDVPQDTVRWTVRNSGRKDVVIAGENRGRQKRGDRVLPPSERHVMRWNGDPYTLDGGEDGRSRDDGTFILLPYWMGRYHRLID